MDDCSSFLVYTQNVFIRAEHGSELCPCAPWPAGVWLQPHTGGGMHTCAASEGYQHLPRGGENWAVPSSLLFLAGISVQLGQQTVSTELLGIASPQGPRRQSHSFCCSGHWTGMETSATRAVTDVTERISKDTKHLCLDSWIGPGTPTHQQNHNHNHKHDLHLWAYCMFQSFSIAMCQRRALGDTFISFGTAA